MPESLRTAVLARVRRAGPGVEALLRAAAVLGASVDPLTVGVMLDLSRHRGRPCEAALGARLLVVSGRDYEFANDLVHEVLYASTPEPTRFAYHRRAMDLLTGQPESLARHAAAAATGCARAGPGCGPARRPWAGLRPATPSALATQALEAAERADDLEVARALVLRGRARETLGAHAEAVDDLTRGAEEPARPVTAGWRCSPCATRRGRPRRPGQADRLLRRTWRRAADRGSLGDRASEAPMLARLAIMWSTGCAWTRGSARAPRRSRPGARRRRPGAGGRPGRTEDRLPLPRRPRRPGRGTSRARTAAAPAG